MAAIRSRIRVILRGWSRDLGIGVELTALGVANVAGYKPPRHPVRNALLRVPTGGELRSQHKLVVRVAAGLTRVAKRQVRRNRLNSDGAFRGAIEIGGRATREKSQENRCRPGRG